MAQGVDSKGKMAQGVEFKGKVAQGVDGKGKMAQGVDALVTKHDNQNLIPRNHGVTPPTSCPLNTQTHRKKNFLSLEKKRFYYHIGLEL